VVCGRVVGRWGVFFFQSGLFAPIKKIVVTNRKKNFYHFFYVRGIEIFFFFSLLITEIQFNLCSWRAYKQKQFVSSLLRVTRGWKTVSRVLEDISWHFTM
jgi:hypothetical protein